MNVQDVTLDQLAALEIPRDDLPSDVRKAVFETILAVGRDLQLSPFPGLKFLPRSAGHRLAVRGIVCPEAASVLWIVAQETPADMVETTAHEGKHAQQIARWGSFTGESFCSMEQREREADAYGKLIRARFVAGRPLVDPAPRRPPPAPAPRAALAMRTGAPRDLSRAAAPATTGRRYRSVTAAEAAGAERRSRMYTRNGRRCIDCEHCAEPAQIGATHHCSAAGRPTKLRRP
jgi:hypothetical protein